MSLRYCPSGVKAKSHLSIFFFHVYVLPWNHFRGSVNIKLLHVLRGIGAVAQELLSTRTASILLFTISCLQTFLWKGPFHALGESSVPIEFLLVRMITLTEESLEVTVPVFPSSVDRLYIHLAIFPPCRSYT